MNASIRASRNLFYVLCFLCLTAFTFSVLNQNDSRKKLLPIGIWRGEIIRADGHPIAFNFETRDSAGKVIIYIINGAERLLVENIRRSQDSVFIELPFFDSRFALRINDEKRMTGNWIKNNGNRLVVMPFQAVLNELNRFPVNHQPRYDISGRWSVHFKTAEKTLEAIGEFTQTGARVTGTFLTSTGDDRYLDGVVDGDTLRLSTFDGGHAYSFISTIQNDRKMSDGFFYSGASSVETWEAEKKDSAKLPDEFSLTKLKDSTNAYLHFRFPDLNGRMVSLSDSNYKNKVTIIQIMGSWCPNCMDETRFLSGYYRENKKRGVEIIGMAYERTTSIEDAKRLFQPYIVGLRVSYPILVTGVTASDSLRSEKTLPELQRIVGFPTTIFIDKTGRVRKIHTGFSGPGTGEHYQEFQKEFNQLINQLLAE